MRTLLPVRSTPRVAAALAALCILPACGGDQAHETQARIVMDRDQPGIYLQVQVADRDVLTGVGAARGLTWHDDRLNREERFAGVDDPRLNNFTAAAQALSRERSGQRSAPRP